MINICPRYVEPRIIVGEKTMISMPTWFFPSGAGPYSQTGDFTTHGDPSPPATLRFAEPIYIDKQQTRA
jgi:hypothetical protein